MDSGYSSLTRRRIIQMTGTSVVGGIAFSQSVLAQESDANVSVKFPDQVSDGGSIVINSLETDVESELLIFESEGDRSMYKRMSLDAGTEFTSRTIDLDNPIPETQLISISVQPPEGGFSYGGARADITIDETVDNPKSTENSGNVHIIRSTEETNFHHPYLLFKPDPEPQTERPLFISPSPLREVSSQEEAVQQARSMGMLQPDWFETPNKNRLPGLIPLIPRTPNDGPDFIRTLTLPTYKSDKLHQNYQIDDLATDGYSPESLTRVDKQLTAMIDDAKTRLSDESYAIADQAHVTGFSAGGDFMTRFAFLYPHRVSTLSAGGGGFAPLPKASISVGDNEEIKLPYPLGTADYKQLTGREFDKEEWKSIDQFVYLGEDDEPRKEGDEVAAQAPSGRDTERGFEVFGRERVTSMFVTLQEVYNDVGASATFKLYENTGHEVTREMREDRISFHSRMLVEEHDVVDISVNQSTDEVRIGEPVIVTVRATNRANVRAATTVTLARNESEAESVDIQVDPHDTETIELETSFNNPGEYQLRVNEMTAGEPVVVTEERTENTDDSSTNGTESTEVSSSESEETSAEEVPGFSIIQSIAALGGFGYLLKRKISNSD